MFLAVLRLFCKISKVLQIQVLQGFTILSFPRIRKKVFRFASLQGFKFSNGQFQFADGDHKVPYRTFPESVYCTGISKCVIMHIIGYNIAWEGVCIAHGLDNCPSWQRHSHWDAAAAAGMPGSRQNRWPTNIQLEWKRWRVQARARAGVRYSHLFWSVASSNPGLPLPGRLAPLWCDVGCWSRTVVVLKLQWTSALAARILLQDR